MSRQLLMGPSGSSGPHQTLVPLLTLGRRSDLAGFVGSCAWHDVGVEDFLGWVLAAFDWLLLRRARRYVRGSSSPDLDKDGVVSSPLLRRFPRCVGRASPSRGRCFITGTRFSRIRGKWVHTGSPLFAPCSHGAHQQQRNATFVASEMSLEAGANLLDEIVVRLMRGPSSAGAVLTHEYGRLGPILPAAPSRLLPPHPVGRRRYCSDRAELANLRVHLTNVAIQKKAGGYDKDVGCKWDLQNLKVLPGNAVQLLRWMGGGGLARGSFVGDGGQRTVRTRAPKGLISPPSPIDSHPWGALVLTVHARRMIHLPRVTIEKYLQLRVAS